jgi:hypothetical protein
MRRWHIGVQAGVANLAASRRHFSSPLRFPGLRGGNDIKPDVVATRDLPLTECAALQELCMS